MGVIESLQRKCDEEEEEEEVEEKSMSEEENRDASEKLDDEDTIAEEKNDEEQNRKGEVELEKTADLKENGKRKLCDEIDSNGNKKNKVTTAAT